MTTDLWIKNKKNAKIAHVIQHACRTVAYCAYHQRVYGNADRENAHPR